ncbi:T9SS type A sorting domain-containing protein [Flavobacterium sp. MAH-1]|uniref:T9SS type A sorting domain-containing protein n=1 Tax=Flavobacterium agri TaxID=2743471 RepID=A0A7Y8XYW9_9FLAO|nr:T9SS type A sorting domain-containing protein [Flavobacterium agri]NUY79454.1 T9SS type A sorting domain-containing protein [Flavobacterium agri]NYA69479.1 T9SS type A sorting domain-containing protein [Flavobacterium agri]
MKKMLLLLFSGFLYAQPTIDWDKTLGGAYSDEVMAIKTLPDGKIILVGSSDSEISGDKTEYCRGYNDYWAFLLEADGTPIWQTAIGADYTETARKIEPAPDGGFFISGESWSGASGDKTLPNRGVNDFWIVKLDADGNLLWERSVGGDDRDEMGYLLPLADGGVVVAGASNSGISGDKSQSLRGITDYWVFRIDNQGQLLWEKTIGGGGYDFPTRISLAQNGNFLVSGSSRSAMTGDRTIPRIGTVDNWIVELSTDGQIVGQQAQPFDFDLSELISDGNYVVCGMKQYGPETTGEYIAKRSPSGALIWEFNGPITIGLVSAKCCVSAPDGGFYYIQEHPVTGNTLTKRTTDGTLVWQRPIDMGAGIVRALYKQPDNSLIMATMSAADITSDKSEISRGQGDYWIVKFNPESELSVDAPSQSKIVAYPNPVENVLYLSNTDGKVEIFNTLGQKIGNAEVSQTHNSVSFPYASGNYLVRFTDQISGETQTLKIIK